MGRSAVPRSPSRRPTTAGFFANHIFWPTSHFQRLVGFYRDRYEHCGHGTRDQAVVGLGGQVFIAPNSQDAVEQFRPYFDHAPVYKHGPSLEEFMAQTPLTAGSPQQVIERTLTFREHFGDYQRSSSLADHAGLPTRTVLEQLDLLGEHVLPVLRRKFDALRPEGVPDWPTHSARIVLVSAGLSEPSSTRLDGVPVLLAATGGSPRHSLALEHALRPLFAYLRAVAVPTSVFAATQDWGGGAELDARIDRAAGELAALVAARQPAPEVDAFDPSAFRFAVFSPPNSD